MLKQTIEYFVSKFKNESDYKEININDKDPMLKTIHESEKVVDLEHHRNQPRFICDSQRLYQLDSFTKYINKFKPGDDADKKRGQTAIFISLSKSGLSVESILDYHSAYDEPTHCRHSVVLDTCEDESYLKWLRSDNEWLSQNNMINLLKKYNNALHDDDFTNLLASIQLVKSDTKLTATQKTGESGNSKAVYFEMIETFSFSFKPYFSMPMKYSIKADLYVQLDRDNKIQLKYSIRNQHTINEQVVEDLTIEFNKIKGIEVF